MTKETARLAKLSIGAAAISLLLCLAVAETCRADTIQFSQESQNGFSVPGFDASLGTLQSVSLTLKVVHGQTDGSGNHNHDPVPHPHPAGNTTQDGLHGHTMTLEDLTGGGLSFPDMTVYFQHAGTHDHQTWSNWTWTTSGGGHAHAFADTMSTHQFSSPSELAPFLGGFSIGASKSYSQDGLHKHGIGTVVTAESGSHYHPVTFDTVSSATFTFAPVPEPSSLVLLVTAALGLLACSGRKRHSRR